MMQILRICTKRGAPPRRRSRHFSETHATSHPQRPQNCHFSGGTCSDTFFFITGISDDFVRIESRLYLRPAHKTHQISAFQPLPNFPPLISNPRSWNPAHPMKPKDTLRHFPALAGIIVFATVSLSLPASGAVLAKYEFGTGTPATATTADATTTTVGSGVVAGNFIASVPGTDQGFSANGNAFLRSTATGSTQADALADDNFFSVTISLANSGDVLNLSSLTLLLGGSADNQSGSPTNWTNEIFLQSSVGGFGTGNAIIAGTNTTSALLRNTGTTFPSSASFDLSGASFQGLETITFQFRFADSTNVSGFVSRIDDVTINGAVIPEPSAALLGSMGLLVLLLRRR
jgi:hypothetical protein